MRPIHGVHWHAAIHEAAHWFVFARLGGPKHTAIEIHIGQKVGYIKQYNFGRLHPEEELIDALTSLAGPVCDKLLLNKAPGRSSDMLYARRWLSTEEDLAAAWRKLEAYLSKHWELLENIACALIANRNKQGIVCERKLKKIAITFQLGI